MGFRIKVRQWDEPFGVDMGATILESALALGLDYPHGCKSGNCGTCKSRLFAGEVAMSPYSEFALSEEEKAGDLILACRAVPWSDCEVAFLETDEVAAHPLRTLSCRVVAAARATHDTTRLRLAIESGGPYHYSAGQYAAVSFGELPPRDYSMASQSNAPEIEFHVREMPGGAISRFVNRGLKPGDTVIVKGPYGLSFLREYHRGPILALAGGSGLAPVKSIVERALCLGMKQDIHLYFGVRDERDLYDEDHFRGFADRHPNLRFIPVLSEPSGATARRTGLLHEVVAEDFSDLDGSKVYAAGPPVMVEACIEVAKARGVRPEDRRSPWTTFKPRRRWRWASCCFSTAA